MVDLSRRQFLLVGGECSRKEDLLHETRQQEIQAKIIRPPWAVEQFAALCSGCGACVQICPEKIISLDDRGKAQVLFEHSGCELCGDCERLCTENALDSKNTVAAWQHKVELNNKCLPLQDIICRTCEEACNEAAIAFVLQAGKVAQPQIDVQSCNGCGFCVALCPVGALEVAG